MTEAEWQTASDPEPMLAHLRGRAGEPELRAFAARCCQRIEDWLGGPWEQSLALVERYAAGRLDPSERAQALEVLLKDYREMIEPDDGQRYLAKEAVLNA